MPDDGRAVVVGEKVGVNIGAVSRGCVFGSQFGSEGQFETSRVVEVRRDFGEADI